jgi:hypothetical protein
LAKRCCGAEVCAATGEAMMSALAASAAILAINFTLYLSPLVTWLTCADHGAEAGVRSSAGDPA